jgi:hypothetical protein
VHCGRIFALGMTIDSSWIACFKEEIPAAFTPLPPFVPDAVFCDGQIKLMCPAVGELFTWADYIFRQFSRALQRYLDSGTQCVILAFDDYQRVPSAKNMTQVCARPVPPTWVPRDPLLVPVQVRRRQNIGAFVFQARQPLPGLVPRGEQWNKCISNRVFKGKVCLSLCLSLFAPSPNSLSPLPPGHPTRD